MKLKLQARDLWDVIEYGDGDFRDDRTALDAICSAVPSEMIPALAIKETATEAWKAIKTLRLGDEKRRAVTAQTLCAEYETIKLCDGESIEDFALRFSGVVQRLAELRDPEPDEKAVKKYLCVIHLRYKQLVVTMEAFVDLSKFSIEEITGTLKSSDDTDEEVTLSANSSTGKLLLERSKQDGKRGELSSGEKRDHKNRRGRGGGGAGRGASRDPNKPSSTPCFKCHQVGHWARYCPNNAKKKEKAHTAQVDDEEEPTLLMAQVSQVNTPSSSAPLTPTPPPAHRRVEIKEQKVFAELGSREDRDPLRWVLDSGATNHMTGAWTAFAELDTDVHGTVRFGDGSMEIEGRGSVVFSCNGGEHRALRGVYYIPRLTADIINLGKLEEVGCCIIMDASVLKIYEPGRKLLARVKRSSSRLYLLELKIDRPVCLSARSTETATSPSSHCAASPTTTWCTDCHRWSRLNNSVTPA
jgi:hypothetical protein